ncbi:MAG: DNA translocase FtsK [Planctomycetes bacterium]|nr:DNA translocase FtsK [Planctomycetota bacterium]
MSKEENNKKSVGKQRLLGVFLFCFGLFLMLSLVTYSPHDYADVAYPVNKTVANKAGSIGAFLAYYAFLFFGIVAFVAAIFISFWGILRFAKREIPSFAIKIASLAIFIFSSCMLVALMTPESFTAWNLSVKMESFGGFIGQALSSTATAYFGYFGSYILALFLMVIAATLATDWIAYYVALWFYQAALKPLGVKLMAKIANRFKPKPVINFPAPTIGSGGGTAVITAAPEGADDKDDSAVATEDEEENNIEEEETNEDSEEAEGVTFGGELAPAATADVPAGPKPKKAPKAVQPISEFILPPIDLLEDAEALDTANDEKAIRDCILVIESTLSNFGVVARVTHVEKGPVVTSYEIELGPGISVHKIAGMADDFAIALKAPNVRIVAPIPGKSTVGIEVPNAFKGIVRVKELLLANPEASQKAALPLFIGKDASGAPLIKDLADMPHLLIAGTTGSGKSICVSSIILSLLMTKTPEQMKLLLIDPKMVELSAFKDIPHLISPVVTDMRRAPLVLKWIVRTMDERYELFLRTGVKKIESYNQLSEEKIREKLSEDGEAPVDVPIRLPYIVVFIDELADLMMAASDDVETAITRISQKSRAVGIHLVMATQRPSVDVITGLIKSNMPARIAFKVASKIDSRTILDRNGAEKLLGQGDMLMLQPSSTDLIRTQGTFVSEKESREVMNFLKKQREPIFDDELLELENKDAMEEIEADPLFEEAAKIVLETQRGSVSLIQRRLAIGYTRAARLVDMMARVGIVGAYKNSKAREVVMTLDEWTQRKNN